MTWAEFLDHVEIRFPLPMQIRALVNRRSPDEVELRVSLTVPDIVTGFAVMVHMTDYPPPLAAIEDPARYLRTLLLKALAHELDETLLIDGIKARDPHTEDVHIPRYL